MAEFWRTIMGQTLIEGHIPTAVRTMKELVKQITRVADHLEARAQPETAPVQDAQHVLARYNDLMARSESEQHLDTGEALEVMALMAEVLGQPPAPVVGEHER